MKNQIFGKTAALVMGSLMIVSGQTLAMEANKQEVTNAEALGEFEFLIAADVPDDQKDISIEALNVAKTKIGDALSQVQGKVESETAKSIAVDILNVAESVVGDALGDVDVEILSKGDAEVALNAINTVKTKLGDAEANLDALIAVEGEDAKVAAELVNVAESSVGDAASALKFAVQQAE